jgi:flagellar hook protein FlgE
MSLFDTLRTGASGLGVAGTNLGVIGDNIANVNTTGFKRSTASFAEQLSLDVGTLGGRAQMGQGALPASIRQNFSQGGFKGTGSALDVAINGSGFFVVNDGSRAMYTRDGSFVLDAEGFVTTTGGLRVQGYNADGDNLSNSIDDLHLDLGPSDPRATSEITLDMVLSPSASTDDDFSSLVLDGVSGATMSEATAAADFTTSVSVYDSLGNPHDVVVSFERSADSKWTWTAMVAGGDTSQGEGDHAKAIANGTLSFDEDGKLNRMTTETVDTSWKWPGARPYSFDMNLGQGKAAGSVRMQNEAEMSSVSAVSQDGWSVGTVAEVAVDAGGEVVARYSNGEEAVLGQLAMANFSAEGGLLRAGGNMYVATTASGDAALGAAGESGRGEVMGYALELSNVDLEAEFIAMIQAQRSYQANAGLIKTADETLQELVNLV